MKRNALSRVESSHIGLGVMASKAEEYRVKAAECDHRAASIRNVEIQKQYQDLIRQWLELAKRADRMAW